MKLVHGNRFIVNSCLYSDSLRAHLVCHPVYHYISPNSYKSAVDFSTRLAYQKWQIQDFERDVGVEGVCVFIANFQNNPFTLKIDKGSQAMNFVIARTIPSTMRF